MKTWEGFDAILPRKGPEATDIYQLPFLIMHGNNKIDKEKEEKELRLSLTHC